MIEHLDDLLAGDHLLNISIQFPQAALLLGIVDTAVPGAEIDIPKHGGIPHHNEQRQPPVEHEKQDQGAGDLDKSLDDQGKAVVQGVRNGVHVVGEQAHQVAFTVGIEKLQGECLQIGKQVAADLSQDFLGGPDHDLAVTQGAEGPHQVDHSGQAHTGSQVGQTAVFQQAVDHRADHIGAQQRRNGTERRQHRHQRQHDPVMFEIAPQAAEGMAQVLRAAPSGDSHHCASPPFI